MHRRTQSRETAFVSRNASLDALALALELDANGAVAGIGDRYDELEEQLLPSDDALLAMGFYFWDCWIDARNHDWYNYRDARRDDWPVFARALATALRGGVAPTDVPESLLVPPPTIRERVRGWLGR